MLKKIISGGQTGVDQAALDAAISCGVEHGGWLPAGRMTENGPLSEKYQLKELSSPSYPARTRKNILESDATLIISHGSLTGGSELTARIAAENNIPLYHLDLHKTNYAEGIDQVGKWLARVRPTILNVAGPRASSDEEIYRKSRDIIVEILKMTNNNG